MYWQFLRELFSYTNEIETTWRWVNDKHIFFFWVNYPFKGSGFSTSVLLQCNICGEELEDYRIVNTPQSGRVERGGWRRSPQPRPRQCSQLKWDCVCVWAERTAERERVCVGNAVGESAWALRAWLRSVKWYLGDSPSWQASRPAGWWLQQLEQAKLKSQVAELYFIF